ncbi:hypothetical protein AVEN_77404-1 [Araneus ventricosus]|uniref:Uncharacterized protein n=1 Tax=Araneus ventricosus TaxID=182803 RepID=A0A4Y2CA07_ARAVE|nr:hypothetical protein AVEN_77404-1 [Araneus ventricosus]
MPVRGLLALDGFKAGCSTPRRWRGGMPNRKLISYAANRKHIIYGHTYMLLHLLLLSPSKCKSPPALIPSLPHGSTPVAFQNLWLRSPNGVLVFEDKLDIQTFDHTTSHQIFALMNGSSF